MKHSLLMFLCLFVVLCGCLSGRENVRKSTGFYVPVEKKAESSVRKKPKRSTRAKKFDPWEANKASDEDAMEMLGLDSKLKLVKVRIDGRVYRTTKEIKETLYELAGLMVGTAKIVEAFTAFDFKIQGKYSPLRHPRGRISSFLTADRDSDLVVTQKECDNAKRIFRNQFGPKELRLSAHVPQ